MKKYVLLVWSLVLVMACGSVAQLTPTAPVDTPTIVSTADASPVVSQTSIATTVAPATITATATLPAPSGNLLVNQSFEGGTHFESGDTNGDRRTPDGWNTWFRTDVHNTCYNLSPHYELEQHPQHVTDQQNSARYYTAYASHDGGLYQRVKVVPGYVYRFEIDGRAWSTSNPIVGAPSETFSKLWTGVDPYGGTDALSPSVVWSAENASMDHFSTFVVDAAAFADHITVFTRSRPDWCVARNDSWWDRASLVVVGPTSEVILQEVGGGGSSLGDGPIEVPPSTLLSGLGSLVFTKDTNIRTCVSPTVGDVSTLSYINCALNDLFFRSALPVPARVHEFFHDSSGNLWASFDPGRTIVAVVCYNNGSRAKFYEGVPPDELSYLLGERELSFTLGCDIK